MVSENHAGFEENIYVTSFLSSCTPSTSSQCQVNIVNQNIQNINSFKHDIYKQKPVAFKRNGLAEKYKSDWRYRNAENKFWFHSVVPDSNNRIIVVERFALIYGKVLAQFIFDDLKVFPASLIQEKKINFLILNENLESITEINRKYEVSFSCNPIKTIAGDIYIPGSRIKVIKPNKTSTLKRVNTNLS